MKASGQKTRIGIWGIGAMGCLFGARLTPHAQVTLIGQWTEQLAALQNRPLDIIHPDKHSESIQITATSHLTDTLDVALILTKAQGTATAARSIAQVLAPDGIAITLQNGLGNADLIADAIGEARTVQGVTMQGASTRGEVGKLYYGGSGPTYLASRPEIAPQIERISSLFNRSHLPTELTEDVSSLIWGKLAINAAINPLTALLRVKNGDLLKSEDARRLMRATADEVAMIAEAQGITLPFDNAAVQAEKVAEMTAYNQSSMFQDVQRGTMTEIETICGAVMRTGERLGIATPNNTLLYQLIKALELLHKQ